MLLVHDMVGRGRPDAPQCNVTLKFSSAMTDFGFVLNIGGTIQMENGILEYSSYNRFFHYYIYT